MKIVERVLWALVILGLAVYVGLSLWLSFRAIVFPYALDYGEGDVFWFTLKLARGQNIYTPLGGPPFDSANYPPVAMLLTAALYSIFENTLAFGRWLNFAAALVIVAFIVRWVSDLTRDRRAALVAGALFLGSTFVYHWMPLYRVDLIGVAFALAGIFCVWQWERRQDTSARPALLYLGAAVLLFLLALYTKHSLLFAPAAAFLAILLRNRRAAVYFALALLGLGGAIFLLLELGTAGGWSFGILALNATVWTPRVFVPLVSSFIVTYAVVLGLGAWGWWTRLRKKHLGVLELYAALALVSIALAGREGAWENYFFEPIAMACVFAGIAIAGMAQTARWQWVAPLLVLLQLALFWNGHDPSIADRLFAEVQASNQDVAPLIRSTQGTVITEDMGLLWSNDKPVEYYSFVYSTLARAGRYDQKWETENLRAGAFPLVVLNQGTREDVDKFGNFTRAFVSALDYGYGIAHEDARYVVYTPSPPAHTTPNVTFGNLFSLVGWTLQPETLAPGQDMELTVVWEALQAPGQRYTTFAQLAKVDGGNIAQDDHEPRGGVYPTTNWAAGEMVRDTYHLRIPANLEPGTYALRVGWYDTYTHDPLTTTDGSDWVELTTLQYP